MVENRSRDKDFVAVGAADQREDGQLVGPAAVLLFWRLSLYPQPRTSLVRLTSEGLDVAKGFGNKIRKITCTRYWL